MEALLEAVKKEAAETSAAEAAKKATEANRPERK
jgi:hypothetical protein